MKLAALLDPALLGVLVGLGCPWHRVIGVLVGLGCPWHRVIHGTPGE
jgi:hypothetical protein